MSDPTYCNHWNLKGQGATVFGISLDTGVFYAQGPGKTPTLMRGERGTRAGP